jgi:hypothetical protein
MSSTYRWAIAAVAGLAIAAPVSAQQFTPEDTGYSALTASLLAPPLFGPPLALDAAEVAPVAPFVAWEGQARESENVAMMIVGGAALVVGSVVDGDAGTLIMVGGGVVGLIGLYRYLR